MTRPRVPRLALALLERFVPDSAPLAGDLVEDFERRQSRGWFWWQVLAAIATAALERSDEVRPLRLVELQPAEALERARRWSIRFEPVTLGSSPRAGVGALGLVVLGIFLTGVAPGAWWVLAASTAAGAFLGAVIIAIHVRSMPSN
jgi:hypothetical protein